MNAAFVKEDDMQDDQPQSPRTDDAKAPLEDAATRRRKQRLRAGMAFGIGSAAITAALLYANRPRAKGKP